MTQTAKFQFGIVALSIVIAMFRTAVWYVENHAVTITVQVLPWTPPYTWPEPFVLIETDVDTDSIMYPRKYANEHIEKEWQAHIRGDCKKYDFQTCKFEGPHNGPTIDKLPARTGKTAYFVGSGSIKRPSIDCETCRCPPEDSCVPEPPIDRMKELEAAHLSGIHNPGFCPFCPPNVYHD